MKRRISFGLIILMLILAFTVGCSNNEPGGPDVDPPAAEAPEFILIGHPNPDTGPLAGFGVATPWADQRVIDFVNADGGIYIEEFDKKIPLKLVVVDTESSPEKASQAATRLVLNEGVDILVSAHTPANTVPVSQVAERYQVPNVSMAAPVASWLSGGPYTWAFHAFFTGPQVVDTYEGLWQEFNDELKVVGLIMPDDADGTIYAEIFNKVLPERGYTVVDPGRFPDDMDDYSSIISEFKSKGVQIVAGVQATPGFATFWRQCIRDGFVPKISTHGKPILLPSAVASIGDDLAHGLTTVVWWSPEHPFKSPLTGETPADIVAAWEEETDRQWEQTLGFNYAALEIADRKSVV